MNRYDALKFVRHFEWFHRLSRDEQEQCLDAIVDAASQEAKSCPCEFGKPCGPNCTCSNPHLSGGCTRCCKYGSDEQRAKAAARIIASERRKSPTRGTGDIGLTKYVWTRASKKGRKSNVDDE